MSEIRIVEHDLTGCINWACSGAPKCRYYVIKTPINETGICKEFNSKEEAEAYAEELKKKQ